MATSQEEGWPPAERRDDDQPVAGMATSQALGWLPAHEDGCQSWAGMTTGQAGPPGLGTGLLQHEARHDVHALQLLEEQLAGVGDPAI